MSQPILIAGAGIGGLAAALALSQKGYTVDVLERRSDAVETGAGIQIGPNGTRLLIRLGVAARLQSSIASPDAIVARNGRTGSTIATMPLGPWIAERHGAPYWTLRRRDLHRALLDTAAADRNIRITRGFDLVSLRDRPAAVDAIADDGRCVSGAALIGADGVWSAVREIVHPGSQPRFTGRSAARAVVAMDRVPPELRANVTGLWLSPGSHLVHYPIRGGAELAIVLIVTDTTDDADWDRDVPAGWIATRTNLLVPLAGALLAAADGWQRWSLVEGGVGDERPPLNDHARVALLGDAAHPILPFLAQGAAMAIEDGVVLADCMAAAGSETSAGLARYRDVRAARTRRVADAARRNGGIYHLPLLPAAARDLVMRAAGGERLIASYDWLYGWHPPT